MPVGGDPHVVRIDGHSFEFDGEHAKRYNIFSVDSLKVAARVLDVPGQEPRRTMIGGVDVYAGDVQVYISSDGYVSVFCQGHHIRVETKTCTLDAPGHLGNTQDEPHPLQGVAHININHEHPEGFDHSQSRGLVVDGDHGADPEKYFVEG